MDKDFALGKKEYLTAIAYIQEKHQNQFRRFSLAPYWVHPIQVACLVQKYKKSHKIDELVIASLLHDVVEDTNTSLKEIRDIFGTLVGNLVEELTSNKEEIKEIGKQNYLALKMADMSSWGLVIKLSDRLSNVSDFIYADKNFVEKYSKETIFIIEHLKRSRKLTTSHEEIIADILKVIGIWG